MYLLQRSAQGYPEEAILLPRIDQVVDGVAGHEVLCFLDAYKSYHQIPMAPEDIEKMMFVPDDVIFCYTRIPFGLKNAQVKF